MWTLEHFEQDGVLHPWPLQETDAVSPDFQPVTSKGAQRFFTALQGFVRSCQPLPAFNYSMVENLVASAEAIEETVHRLPTAPVLRFSVVMAVEDFVKKTMVAKDEQLRTDLSKKKSAAAAGSPVEVASVETAFDLAYAVESVQHAALVVVLACEAAWNASRLQVVWETSELDLPEE